jgi:ABC-type Fe3+ transport system permease subunit
VPAPAEEPRPRRHDEAEDGGDHGREATFGYAIPGAILAIGLLPPLAALDGLLDGASRALTGAPGRPRAEAHGGERRAGERPARAVEEAVEGGERRQLGTGAALVYAYAVRFLAVTAGSSEAGLARVPRSLAGSSLTQSTKTRSAPPRSAGQVSGRWTFARAPTCR